MQPAAPITIDDDLRRAQEAATAECQPVFVPAPVYCDDRGWSLMNQFQGVLAPEGQINFSIQYPGVVKAWHRHRKQTDFWLCLTGHIKIGLHREVDAMSWMIVTGEKRPGVVIIPPPLWHGAATVGPVAAGLLYYVTKAFDPAAPDEERLPHDGLPGFAWTVEQR